MNTNWGKQYNMILNISQYKTKQNKDNFLVNVNMVHIKTMLD